MEAIESNARPFTGRKMLLSMLAFFGVIIVVNLGLLSFALDSDNGLVVKNSYVASQDYNRMMAKARAQEELGWRAAVTHRAGVVELRFTDGAGAPLTGLEIAGRLGRPVTDREDRPVAFREAGSGLYRTDAALGAGEWELDAVARDGAGAEFRRIVRFFVKDPGQ